jgi:hypothetical protein
MGRELARERAVLTSMPWAVVSSSPDEKNKAWRICGFCPLALEFPPMAGYCVIGFARRTGFNPPQE